MKALALVLMFCAGCAGTFEEARLVAKAPPGAKIATEPRDQGLCAALDARRRRDGFLAKVLAGLAGASGLAAIPVHSDGLRDGLLIGAAVSGVAASGFVYLSEDDGVAWVQACAP